MTLLSSSLQVVQSVWQDCRISFRMLRRVPIFSAIAIGCLALGIAATTVVFSWTESILLRPYAGVADQYRLIVVAGISPRSGDFDEVSWPDYRDLAAGASAFSGISAEKIIFAKVQRNGETGGERIFGLIVSSNYFDVLSVRLALGRDFPRLELNFRDDWHRPIKSASSGLHSPLSSREMPPDARSAAALTGSSPRCA